MRRTFTARYGYGLVDLRRRRRSRDRPHRRDLRLYRLHADESHARLRRDRVRESRRGAAASVRDRALRHAGACARRASGEPLRRRRRARPAHVDHAGDYAGTYTASNGATLRVAARDGRLTLIDGAQVDRALSARSGSLLGRRSQVCAFLFVFGRDRKRQRRRDDVRLAVVSRTSATVARVRSRIRTLGTRSSDDTRTRSSASRSITRVLIVKDRLTLDGTDALRPLANGTFALGRIHRALRRLRRKEPQRLSIDDTHLYRVELP